MASTLFKILYISSIFTHITTPFISINLDILQNSLEQRLFLLSYVFFKNQNITFFSSFFIFMLRMINLFFDFKNKNWCYLCRFYHECTIELTDWLIWLVHQFWLVNLNKHQLVEINSSGADPEGTCDFSKFKVWKNVSHHDWPTEKIFDFRWAKALLKYISLP